MKLSFTTLGCPKWSWKQIVENAAAYGYKGIELRGVEGELYLPKVSYFSDLNLKDTLNYLKEKNIKIVCLGSSVNFHDPLNHEKNLNEAKDYIELAEKMGVALAKGVVSGKGKPGIGDTFKPEPLGIITALEAEEDTPQIIEYNSELSYEDLTNAMSKMKSGYKTFTF